MLDTVVKIMLLKRLYMMNWLKKPDCNTKIEEIEIKKYLTTINPLLLLNLIIWKEKINLASKKYIADFVKKRKNFMKNLLKIYQ